MAVFYFTYGSEGHPYVGGWTMVEAPDEAVAREVFTVAHPSGENGFLRCSDVYTEDEFMRTRMFAKGNLGARCHELLVYKQVVFDG